MVPLPFFGLCTCTPGANRPRVKMIKHDRVCDSIHVCTLLCSATGPDHYMDVGSSCYRQMRTRQASCICCFHLSTPSKAGRLSNSCMLLLHDQMPSSYWVPHLTSIIISLWVSKSPKSSAPAMTMARSGRTHWLVHAMPLCSPGHLLLRLPSCFAGWAPCAPSQGPPESAVLTVPTAGADLSVSVTDH